MLLLLSGVLVIGNCYRNFIFAPHRGAENSSEIHFFNSVDLSCRFIRDLRHSCLSLINGSTLVFLTTGDFFCLAAYFSAWSRLVKTLPEVSPSLYVTVRRKYSFWNLPLMLRRLLSTRPVIPASRNARSVTGAALPLAGSAEHALRLYFPAHTLACPYFLS